MEIKILETYFQGIHKNRYWGTVTANVLFMSLRGIRFYGRRGTLDRVEIPYAYGVNLETGEDCRYPFFVFSDREQNKAFIKELRQQVFDAIKDDIQDLSKIKLAQKPARYKKN